MAKILYTPIFQKFQENQVYRFLLLSESTVVESEDQIQRGVADWQDEQDFFGFNYSGENAKLIDFGVGEVMGPPLHRAVLGHLQILTYPNQVETPEMQQSHDRKLEEYQTILARVEAGLPIDATVLEQKRDQELEEYQKYQQEEEEQKDSNEPRWYAGELPSFEELLRHLLDE